MQIQRRVGGLRPLQDDQDQGGEAADRPRHLRGQEEHHQALPQGRLSARYNVAPQGTQALCPGAAETQNDDRRSPQVLYVLFLLFIKFSPLRYIDLIHQRGQALFNAYNDMRKKLGDVRNEISIIGRKNHDAEQTIAR